MPEPQGGCQSGSGKCADMRPATVPHSGHSEACLVYFSTGSAEQRNGNTGSTRDWYHLVCGTSVAARRGIAEESALNLNWEPPPHHQVAEVMLCLHCMIIWTRLFGMPGYSASATARIYSEGDTGCGNNAEGSNAGSHLHSLLLQPELMKRGLTFAGRNGRTAPCTEGYSKCRAAHHAHQIATTR